MSLQLGQEKSLCIPPTIPTNLGAGQKTEPADAKQWGLQTDSKQLGTTAAPSSPQPTTWQRSQTDVGLQTEDQQSPLRSLGTNQLLRVSTQVGESRSEQRAGGLGSGWTHLPAQVERPWVGTPLKLGGWHRVALRTERNLSMALGNSESQRMQKGLQEPGLFLIVSEAVRGLLQSYCWQWIS